MTTASFDQLRPNPALKRISRLVSVNTMILLYKTFVVPHLEYCTLFAPHYIFIRVKTSVNIMNV